MPSYYVKVDDRLPEMERMKLSLFQRIKEERDFWRHQAKNAEIQAKAWDQMLAGLGVSHEL